MSIDFDVSRTLLWIVLLPLLGAVVNGIAGRNAHKNLVTGVAVGSVAGAFALSLMGFGFLLAQGEEGQQRLVHDVYEWFSISVRGVDVPIRVRFVMDHLSGIMTVMVTGIASLIHVYSIGYMEDDPGYARFMTYLNLFTASMLILVLASNLPLMFVGWEGVGLCSYLLIGFWYTNADYAAAGRKAFVVNRIGDFGVLIGMFLLVSAVADPRTPDAFEFAQINSVATRLGLTEVSFGATTIGMSIATAATLFIFLGCTGKSAQIPLFTWLPDAMAGPTPVSALIHAATMVTAGVYLCCRLSPVIVESPVGMSVIAIVGALTALLAASIALVQNQMKKILAYSTVSQLGFMFAAVGSGAFAGGFFHVFTHAFFKACLFLGAGSVMHAVHSHGDADIRYLGGLRKKLPHTHITFAVATAAIAGVPLLSGFFSKDEILLGAATWGTTSPLAPWVGWLVFGILIIAATMTAFYMFRLYFRTFWGTYKGGHPPGEHHGEEGEEAPDVEDAHHVEPHESPQTMTIPLYVLAAGAAVVGFLGLPHALHLPNWWAQWLTPQSERFLTAMNEAVAAGAGHEEAMRQGTAAAREVVGSVASLQFEGQMVHAPAWVGFLAMGLGTLAALAGIGLAYAWYFREGNEAPARLKSSVPWLHRFLMNKWYVDEAYDWVIVSPMKWLAVFSANVDRFFVDGILTRASAAAAQAGGWLLTRTQSGVIYAYAGLFVLGFAALGWWFTYPHASLEAEPAMGEIQWSAARGLGYEYRWDFDSDGEWETEWTDQSNPTHDYTGAAYYGLVGVLETPRDMFGPTELHVAAEDDPVAIPTDMLGPSWARDPEASTVPPTLEYVDGQMLVRINGAAVPDRDGEDDGLLTLEPGQTLTVGGARLTVAVRVRGTVEIRNPFGNLARGSEDVTLRVSRRVARAEVE
ncbi:MAG TPA: NADH-quinone oxidoreductase subunit L [Sandaracinaceae bacterium LLY-WYZ-13_1]|nr:NADH-quinone oxidoreductase subunit L [Sandaracinaceae bacterium LLY-WYZ-13_1]